MSRFRSLLFIGLIAAPLAAQTAPPAEELVAEALAKSPALAAARARLAAAREMEAPAAALADPMVEAMVQDADFPSYTIGSEDMSMAGIEVRQPLPFPGKRRAQVASARAETAFRETELAEVGRRIATEVRTLYARLYDVDSESRSLTAARELVELLAATASARYAAGEADQESLLKAQLQETRLEEQLDDLKTERQGLVAELNRWLDRPGDAPIGEVSGLPIVGAPAGSWQGRALERSAAVAVARAAVVNAERRLATTRLDLKPDFSPAAGLALRGSLGPVLTLRVGVELPFWKRQKQVPRILAAEAETEMVRQELRDIEAMARAEAARLEAEWAQAGRQIVRYQEGILPQTSAALDAARSSYLAGRGDFSTVIEDFSLWLEARVQLARREAARYTTWARLEALTGGPP